MMQLMLRKDGTYKWFSAGNPPLPKWKEYVQPKIKFAFIGEAVPDAEYNTYYRNEAPIGLLIYAEKEE